MSTKASLETLARTMSISLLCLAVIGLGKEQVAPTPETTTSTEVDYSVMQTVLNKLKAQEPITVKRKANTVSRSRPASLRQAPSGVTERGIWLKELLKEVGFKGEALRTAWAVAMKESTGRPTAYNGNEATGDNSYGIFQINMIGSLGTERRAKFNLSSNKELFNPLKNAKIAYYMTNGGENWRSWDIDPNGYNGGVSESKYKEWLARYPKG